MDRGHLDPPVATLPSAAERCGPVGERAAALGWPLGTDDIVRALGG